MRISSSSIYDSGTTRMTELQQALQRSQQMISTGKRVLTAADDPVAAARALEVTQGQAINTQYAVNRKSVASTLGQEENVLSSVTALLQDVKTLTVNAGNGALDVNQLKFIGQEVKGKLEELMGLANSRDAIGNYVFAGFQTNTQPFTMTASGVVFNGDDGKRVMQVASTRQMAMSDSGYEVFSAIRNGNGHFVTGPTPPYANTGSAIVSPGTLTGTMSSDNYRIVFNSTPAGMTYSVFNTTTDPTMSGAPESTGPYVDGQAITMDGGARTVEVRGTPGNGDSFDIQPSRNESMFDTIQNLVTALTTAQATPQGRTQLAASLSIANQNIDNGLDNVLTVRASVGARMKELDNLDNEGDARNEVYASTLRDLIDLDYVKAISDLSQQTVTLEAAQKSFVKVTGLSLFNFI